MNDGRRNWDQCWAADLIQIGHPCDIGQAWRYKHFCYSVKRLRNMVSQLCSFWFGLAKLLITSCSSL